MKPHPRIRETIKWGGAVATLLLIVLWIGSGWWMVGWMNGKGEEVWLGGGGVRVDTLGPPDPDGVMTVTTDRGWVAVGAPNFGINWRFYREHNGGFTHTFIPLWLPALLAAVVAIGAWRLDILARRRARITHCPKCGYDRAGIAGEAKCPECGASPTTP